jgi:surfactin synthase thioesterase subunit
LLLLYLTVSFCNIRYINRRPLAIPIVAFDGRLDNTIDRGNMRQWHHYTTAQSRIVAVKGDHYFVSKQYKEVSVNDKRLLKFGMIKV